MKSQTDDQTGQESIVKADAKRSKLQSFKLRAIVIAIIGIIVAIIALCMLVYGALSQSPHQHRQPTLLQCKILRPR